MPVLRAPARSAAVAATLALTLAAAAPDPAQASRSRPIVTLLSVSASVPTGPPPAVTVEISGGASRRVHAIVAINSLQRRWQVVAVELGWVPTGQAIAVPWPRGLELQAGSYHVAVTARDRRGRPLLRSPARPGVATFAVLAPPPAPAANPPAPAAGEPGVPSVAATVEAGAVFPVVGPHSFGGPENAFGAPRDGYTHQGQDILTAEGTPIVAPLAGSVLTASYQAAGAGYYAVEQTAIGFDLMFAHCEPESLLVGAGEELAAAQQICRAGQTGDATTPHLDFEMWVGGWHSEGSRPIDPLPYLEAWERAAA